jgi:hypothetical protein
VDFENTEAMVVPMQVLALEVLFKFYDLPVLGGKVLDELDWNHEGRRDGTASFKAALTGNKYSVFVHYDRIDNTDSANGLGQFLDSLEFPALAFISFNYDSFDTEYVECMHSIHKPSKKFLFAGLKRRGWRSPP